MPLVKGATDVSNISKEFTSEIPRDSIEVRTALTESKLARFEDFSYAGEETLKR